MLAGCLIGAGLAGCQGNAPPPGPVGMAGARSTAYPMLGMRQRAGAFILTLDAEPASPAGRTLFEATVTRDSRLARNADVTLRLAAPGSALASPGAEQHPMRYMAGGTYYYETGLSRTGTWTAEVTVRSGAAAGSARYTFDVAPRTGDGRETP